VEFLVYSLIQVFFWEWRLQSSNAWNQSKREKKIHKWTPKNYGQSS
jgi:hypothetical protein